MAKPQRDTVPLVVIYPRLDAEEYRDSLMGSVVKYPDMPIERYIPSKSTTQPRQIIPTIDSKPFQVRNIGFLTHGINDVNISSVVNEIVEGFSGSSKKNADTLARIWHMDSPDKSFEELVKNKTYFKQLFNMLESSHDKEGYFITDIVTLVDITERPPGLHGRYMGKLASRRTQHGLLGQQQVMREDEYSGYGEGELIVFLGYCPVRLEKVNSFMAMVGRIFQGQGYGYTVRFDFNYRPQIKTPTKNTDTSSDVTNVWKTQDQAQWVVESDKHIEIVRALGFNVKIVE